MWLLSPSCPVSAVPIWLIALLSGKPLILISPLDPFCVLCGWQDLRVSSTWQMSKLRLRKGKWSARDDIAWICSLESWYIFSLLWSFTVSSYYLNFINGHISQDYTECSSQYPSQTDLNWRWSWRCFRHGWIKGFKHMALHSYSFLDSAFFSFGFIFSMNNDKN